MMSTGEGDKAQILLNQAYYITQKYGINFEFDINPEHYLDFSQLTITEDEPEIVENSEELTSMESLGAVEVTEESEG